MPRTFEVQEKLLKTLWFQQLSVMVLGLLGQQYLYWGQKELKQVDQECQRDALLTQWR